VLKISIVSGMPLPLSLIVSISEVSETLKETLIIPCSPGLKANFREFVITSFIIRPMV
jgi:hypothetical protein